MSQSASYRCCKFRSRQYDYLGSMNCYPRAGMATVSCVPNLPLMVEFLITGIYKVLPLRIYLQDLY